MKTLRKGFTLVEIAIVLVIVGLLIGGILRGQELITSARTRNITGQMQSVQIAYYAFQDRFKMMPGDLTTAQVSIVNTSGAVQAACTDSNAGVVTDLQGDGWVSLGNSPAFFNNLAQAGFIVCAQCMSVPSGSCPATALTPVNSPVNLYGQPIYFTYPNPSNMTAATNAYNSFYLSNLTNEGSKGLVATGTGVTSAILAEIDRKMDDGNPATGQLRYSDYFTNGGIASSANAKSNWATCITGASGTLATTGNPLPFAWVASPPGANCNGVLLL